MLRTCSLFLVIPILIGGQPNPARGAHRVSGDPAAGWTAAQKGGSDRDGDEAKGREASAGPSQSKAREEPAQPAQSKGREGGAEEAAQGKGRGQPPAAPPSRQAGPRRAAPPPVRVLPPRYDVRTYYFPVISIQRGFYYHPYFGFYYGPYYGPYYPYAGPFVDRQRYRTGAIRTRVTPVETEVYLNGYYAGLADDFDGVFQRLYVPAGEHEIELHLEGYRTFRQRIYASPGDTLDLTHRMVPLASGEVPGPPEPPRTLPSEWTAGAVPAGERPASPFGILVLRVEPADAQIAIDGEVWLGTASRTELAIHVAAGWHTLEIRKAGYQPFRTEIELSEGATTRLNVQLVR
jgi:hypothetical protein